MDERGVPILGKSYLDHAAPKCNYRHSMLPFGSPYPPAGVRTDLSSQVVQRASLSVAATDSSDTVNSFWGYLVVGVIAIAGVYAITQA
jgi:hypothetical protein